MPELFLEIGAEEIPARFMSLALDYLEKEIPSFLKKNRILIKLTNFCNIFVTQQG